MRNTSWNKRKGNAGNIGSKMKSNINLHGSNNTKTRTRGNFRGDTKEGIGRPGSSTLRGTVKAGRCPFPKEVGIKKTLISRRRVFPKEFDEGVGVEVPESKRVFEFELRGS
jgi:hypothetical protein